MTEFKLQSKVIGVLGQGGGYTLNELALKLGVKPTSTLRCILDTLVFCEALVRSVEYSDNGRLAWRYYIND
jgi:hypothetical protein